MDRVLVGIVVIGFMGLPIVLFAPAGAIFRTSYITVFILSLSIAYTIMVRRTARERGWDRGSNDRVPF